MSRHCRRESHKHSAARSYLTRHRSREIQTPFAREFQRFGAAPVTGITASSPDAPVAASKAADVSGGRGPEQLSFGQSTGPGRNHYPGGRAARARR